VKILIAGSGGQLGRALQASAPAEHLIAAPAEADFDITDETQVIATIAAHKPDLVINAAAYTAVDKAEGDPARARLINATAVEYLAAHSPALVQISTDFVFDGTASRPIPPEARPNPLSIYGASKRASELAALPADPAPMSFMPQNLLVTGGAGFIGVNFVHYWEARYPQSRITVLDSLTYAGNPKSLTGARAKLVVGDIRDQPLVESLLRDRGIETIVHFAAESHVDRSIHGPAAFVDTNILGTLSLLQAARAVWLEGAGTPHRFHHVSTDEVFGTLGPADPAFSETTAYAPNSPYAASKAGSDHLVRAWHHTYGLQVTTSNCSNNYGPFQFPEKLIPLFLINALHGRPLPIYGDGRQVRDWLHVEDHCRGIEAVLTRGAVGETYCIGGGAELPNLTVIDTLCAAVDAAFGEDPRLATRFPDAPAARGLATASLKTFVTDRPGHDRRYAIDCSRARTELGYAPAHDFTGGFAETLGWYLAHEDWWRAIMDGSYRAWVEANYARRG
jgi:dTDP-glucose 4,6-dehydratase